MLFVNFDCNNPKFSDLNCVDCSTAVKVEILTSSHFLHNGPVVGCQTSNLEVLGLNPAEVLCCVLKQDTLSPHSTGLIRRKQWLHPDMTQKLLNWALSQPNQNCLHMTQK